MNCLIIYSQIEDSKSGQNPHGVQLQAITAMKEYNNKSFEELHFEDIAVGI
jgi:hypothetical protein